MAEKALSTQAAMKTHEMDFSIEQYQQEGYTGPLPLLSAEEAAAGRTAYFHAIGQSEAAPGPTNEPPGGFNLRYRWAYELATHGKTLDYAEEILGPDIVLWAMVFWYKEPHNTKYIPWHQDATYWGFEPPKVMTAWLAIDDSDTENGAMMVIPGTHSSGIFEHGKSDKEGNLLSVNQAIDTCHFNESTAVTLELRAGQISLHHGLVVHGSLPNYSTRRRCGLTLRYTTPDVKFIPRDDQLFYWKTVLVRGEDRFGNLELVPAPTF